jgi:AcrR family transcriptional regulator
MTQVEPLTRRERQREATFAEIVEVSRALLAEDGADLSLRAVASRMGMTAPALYRYVSSYQELVDLVAFEIDKAATLDFEAAVAEVPADDLAGRLTIASAAFRQWAVRNPREFTLAFLNPIATVNCIRREMVTTSTSGHFFTDLMFELWQRDRFPVPALDELTPTVRESVLDPLMPAKVEKIPEEQRGLVWVYLQGWSVLHGVVALEVSGNMDPRLIESGDMFVHALSTFLPVMGLDAERPRLEAMLREFIAR